MKLFVNVRYEHALGKHTLIFKCGEDNKDEVLKLLKECFGHELELETEYVNKITTYRVSSQNKLKFNMLRESLRDIAKGQVN